MKNILLLLFTCFAYTSHAQRVLTGTVVDEQKRPIPGASVQIMLNHAGTTTNASGSFRLPLSDGKTTIQVSNVGYETVSFNVTRVARANVMLLEKTDSILRVQIILKAVNTQLKEVVGMALQGRAAGSAVPSAGKTMYKKAAPSYAPGLSAVVADAGSEEYGTIDENRFHNTKDQPLSTFSTDVDRAAYSNVRRFLNDGELPPADAVRVEEMINYFDYQYKAPAGTDPVAIYTDMANCPWQPDHKLVRIGLQAQNIPSDALPPSNLVFLLDVSGSMNAENKLPLVKKALTMLVSQLRPQDRVAIVVYAGAAGLALPSTPGSEKKMITDALDKLSAGGSTAGGEGIELAYQTAMEHLMPNGNNRVILATDGDFNVGVSSDNQLEKLITEKREKGISLSVLGFGMGNLKDRKLEMLADKGNGNYGYIDNFEEARRTFVTEFGGTLFTVAKDVKLQIEFNPRYVQSYRLVGYENRMLNNEDFNDDKKDAGDIGSGQTVTALYEIIPANGSGVVNWTDPLKYQQNIPINGFPGEALTVKMRYKSPREKKSQLLTKVLSWQEGSIEKAPEDFRMAAAVAAFGMLLRHSEFKGQATYQQVMELAQKARGNDPEGYRAEFVQLVKKAALLDKGAVASNHEE